MYRAHENSPAYVLLNMFLNIFNELDNNCVYKFARRRWRRVPIHFYYKSINSFMNDMFSIRIQFIRFLVFCICFFLQPLAWIHICLCEIKRKISFSPSVVWLVFVHFWICGSLNFHFGQCANIKMENIFNFSSDAIVRDPQ